MSRRVLLRLKAADDAENIADYIANDSLAAAVRFLENTESTLQRLATFPSTGSPFLSDVPELADLRFCRVKGFPNHVIFFIEQQNSIEVVRILHDARDLEAELKKNWRVYPD